MRKLAIILVFFLTFSCSVFAEDIEIMGEEFYNKTAQDVVSGETGP